MRLKNNKDTGYITGLLSNYINESGRTYARIYVSNKTPQASFSGVWSPDYKD